MICKFCNAQIDDDSIFCTACGKELADEITPDQPQTEPITEDMTQCAKEDACDMPAEQSQLSETAEEQPTEPETTKKKKWPLVLGIIAAALGLVMLAAILVVTVLTALGVEIKIPKNDIFRKEVYTATDEKAEKKADVVVATIGDAELTNAQLQIFYRMQVLDFINYYGSYLEDIGFDYTQPLSEQPSYFDKTMTWEQYFINVSIQTWQNFQTLALTAEEAGFQLDETWETEFAAIPESMEEQAVEGSYENAAAMLKELLGPGCTMEDYTAYIRLNALANEYYATEYEKMTPTAEEVETYFLENEQAFAQNGITKDSGLVSSVRHILVCPDNGTVSEDGYTTTYSDEEWAACLAEAEKILEQWKSGDATEESFTALVATYTEDPGSVSTGGLYENITPTSNYVENFLNWSVDMNRQTGDTGIVQTGYGYHIMYFVSGEPYWSNVAQTQLLSERASKLIDEAQKAWPMKVTYNKIILAELELGS